MNLPYTARLAAVIVVSLWITGCASERPAVTRYGPTVFSYPAGVKVEGAHARRGSAPDFAAAFEGEGFSAHSHSEVAGRAGSSWGSCAFGMNGKAVVVRDYFAAGEPPLRIVSVDGKYDTPLGQAITDWMIQQSGLPERRASLRQPKRMPKPAAHFYATSLYGFDADPMRLAGALRATAAAQGWTATESDQVELDGVTIGRYAFVDAQGRAVTVDAYSARFRPTLVDVTYGSSDPNGPLKVFNGLKDRLALPIYAAGPSAGTALAARD